MHVRINKYTDVCTWMKTAGWTEALVFCGSSLRQTAVLCCSFMLAVTLNHRESSLPSTPDEQLALYTPAVRTGACLSSTGFSICSHTQDLPADTLSSHILSSKNRPKTSECDHVSMLMTNGNAVSHNNDRTNMNNTGASSDSSSKRIFRLTNEWRNWHEDSDSSSICIVILKDTPFQMVTRRLTRSAE